MRKSYLLYATLSTCALWGAPIGPPPPGSQSAGVVERELKKDYEAQPLEQTKEVPDLKIDIPEERLKMPSKIKVSLYSVQIEGNEAFSCDEIRSWIKDRFPCEMSIKDIYDLCLLIDTKYGEQGYFLARAYPPQQKIENGILTIRIIEGRLGAVKVEGNRRYSTKFIERYFTQLKNRPLKYDELMRALILLNENSDLTAGAVFEKGKEVGTADLILRIKDQYPLHLYLNANNYGRKLTTNYRLGGRFDGGNLLLEGDKLSIAEVVGFPMDALYFTDVRYRVPLTATGAFLEGAFLYSKFDIETLRIFHLSGKSVIWTLKGGYALTRKRNLSVDLFSYFDIKQIQNFAMSSLTSYDKLRVLTAGFLIDHFDSSGRDYLNVRVGCGIPHFLGGLKVTAPTSSRPPYGGRFILFNADYDRLQNLWWQDYFLYLHASGQFSPNHLTIPEQLYIGGADTVRGFPLACALGDSGYYANVELRLPLPFLANQRFFMAKKKWREVVQVVGFLDQGGVFLRSAMNTFLWGAGMGVRFKGPWGLSLSCDVGYPLNHPDLSSGAFTYIKVTGQPF